MNRLLKNIIQHFKTNPYRRHFNAENLQQLKQSVAQAEIGHLGEIRLVVECQLPFSWVMHKRTSRQRAVQWFSDLHVWDTEHNTGIVLYLLLSERKIEIVADRGITHKVAQSHWDEICIQLQNKLSVNEVIEGIQNTLNQFGEILRQHYPNEAGEKNPNELVDDLIVLF